MGSSTRPPCDSAVRLEESLRARETLTRTFRRCFPPILALTGARAVALTTRDEEMVEQTWSEGDWGGRAAGALLEGSAGVRRLGWRRHRARAVRALDTVAEQLDAVLCLVQTASEKHQLILQCNRHLANPVFEVGMDLAVLTLALRVRLPGFLLLYRDAVQPRALHYRTYRNGHLEFESGEQPHAALEAAIRQHGPRLLHDPTYAQHLRAQDQVVGILFADINGFTRICEQGFDSPRSIGRFGPPFFKGTPRERAQAALCERVKLPGLGVAIGVNLANANCGLFGPNRQYTAFSSGMNQTARLQSLAGLRETLVMDSVYAALAGSEEPFFRWLRFGPLTETPVKNVAQPLRHYRLEPLTP